ncbi:hypothetical protein [Olivibacter domesticus]|nr:hypothetical protein [Olivibacter domesticus]
MKEELLKSDNPFAIAILVGRTAFAGNRIKDSQEHDAVLMKLKLQ